MTTHHRQAPPPPPNKQNYGVIIKSPSRPSSAKSFGSTITVNDIQDHSPTPPPYNMNSYSPSNSNYSSNTSIASNSPTKSIKLPPAFTNSTNTSSSTNNKSKINNAPNVKPSSFQSKSKYKVKPKPPLTNAASVKLKKSNSASALDPPTKRSHSVQQPPPPVPPHISAKYKQNSPKKKSHSSKPQFFQTHEKSPTLKSSQSQKTINTIYGIGHSIIPSPPSSTSTSSPQSIPPTPPPPPASTQINTSSSATSFGQNNNNKIKVKAKTKTKAKSKLKEISTSSSVKPPPSPPIKKLKSKSKVDSPRPKINSSTTKSAYILKATPTSQGMIIPDDKPIKPSPTIPKKHNNNLIQSRSSPTHADVDEYNNALNKYNDNNHIKNNNKTENNNNNNNNNNHNNHNNHNNMKRKKNKRNKTATSQRISHSRENSLSYMTDNGVNSNIDAVTFNSLLLMQDIETYRVTFNTRVCGIELIPFDENSNLGAVVIKCHTEFSRDKVKIDSLLIKINGQVCVDTDYDEILSIISSSTRPLKLTFHPPTLNKNEMIDEMAWRQNDKYSDHKSRPSIAMKLNDDFGMDADLDYDYNEYQNNSFIHPNSLFNNNNKANNNNNQRNDKSLQLIQKQYTMLYHKYCELKQFEQLTKDTIHDKMNEVKRLTKENTNLKAILSTKESELQRIQMNQSTEKQKGREILDKNQKLTDKNNQFEKQNIEQKQLIQQLQYDLKQSKIQIRELQRLQNENNNNNHHHHNHNFKRNKKRKESNKQKSVPSMHYKSQSNSSQYSVDEKLQDELRKKLSIGTVNGNNNMHHNNNVGYKNSVYHRHKTPPPPLLHRGHHHHHHNNNNNINNKDRIRLQTPIHQNSEEQEQQRSRSTNDGHKILKQKRSSAIGMLFKNFGKRKDTSSSNGSDSSSKYHPQLAKMVKKKKRKKAMSGKGGGRNARNGRNGRKGPNGINPAAFNVESRTRSTSLESNTGRARKETIV